MPAGEPHTMLSPIEKAVLMHCDQWRTVRELQEQLWSEFHFDRIPSTLSFLHRRKLLETWTPSEPVAGLLVPRDVLYLQTGLGVLVLQAQLRKEADSDFYPERRLRVV